MKIFIVLFLFALVLSTSSSLSARETTAFDYFNKIGIPEAERLKKAEDYLQNSSNRVVGGKPAEPNQIPYQAGLIIDMQNIEGKAICGASLISTTSLVTAAHCWFDGVNQAWQHTVILGSSLLFSGGIRIASTNVVPHPDWNPSVIRNDIAIIKLPEAVTLSASISPISLPSSSEVDDYVGKPAMVSGFGKTSDSSGITINQYLSQVSLDIYTNAICAVVYPGIMQDTNVCTSGFGGKGPCGGDSGGPLVIVDKEPVLVGVVSFGSSYGCEVGLPSAYTRVTSFIEFINKYM